MLVHKQLTLSPVISSSPSPKLELEASEVARDDWEEDWTAMVPASLSADLPGFLCRHQ